MMNRQNFLSFCVGLVLVSALGDQKVTNCVTRKEFISTIEKIVKQTEGNEERYNKQLQLLRERVNELENLTTNQQKEIKKYHAQFNYMKEKTDNYNYGNSAATDRYLSPNPKGIQKNGDKRNIGDNTTQIAFFAESNNLSDLGKDQIIVFSKVRTNIGNLYNAHTGVFYCDVTGVYVFFTTIVSEVNHSIWTYLDKNGSRMFGVVSPHIESDFGTSTNMAVIRLERGDSVTVKSFRVVSGPAIDDWSTFSGFLLYPIL